MEWLLQMDLLTPAGIGAVVMILFNLIKFMGFKEVKNITPKYPLYAMGVIFLLSICVSFITLFVYDDPPTIQIALFNGIAAGFIASGQHEWFANIWNQISGSATKKFQR